jgi:hypothetical protein
MLGSDIAVDRDVGHSVIYICRRLPLPLRRAKLIVCDVRTAAQCDANMSLLFVLDPILLVQAQCINVRLKFSAPIGARKLSFGIQWGNYSGNLIVPVPVLLSGCAIFLVIPVISAFRLFRGIPSSQVKLVHNTYGIIGAATICSALLFWNDYLLIVLY